jgi:RNase P/RNase MRP subunit p30
MHNDLVLFSDLNAIEEVAVFTGNEIIVAGDFSEKQLSELRQQSNDMQHNFRFCKVLTQPDHKQLQHFRNKADFIAADGKDMQMNKFACSTKGIDFLLQPFDEGKLYFDVSMARLAAANNVKIAFLFSNFLSASGPRLSLMLKNAAIVNRLVKRARAQQVIFSGAANKWELRSKENLDEFLERLK